MSDKTKNKKVKKNRKGKQQPRHTNLVLQPSNNNNQAPQTGHGMIADLKDIGFGQIPGPPPPLIKGSKGKQQRSNNRNQVPQKRHVAGGNMPGAMPGYHIMGPPKLRQSKGKQQPSNNRNQVPQKGHGYHRKAQQPLRQSTTGISGPSNDDLTAKLETEADRKAFAALIRVRLNINHLPSRGLYHIFLDALYVAIVNNDGNGILLNCYEIHNLYKYADVMWPTLNHDNVCPDASAKEPNFKEIRVDQLDGIYYLFQVTHPTKDKPLRSNLKKLTMKILQQKDPRKVCHEIEQTYAGVYVNMLKLGICGNNQLNQQEIATLKATLKILEYGYERHMARQIGMGDAELSRMRDAAKGHSEKMPSGNYPILQILTAMNQANQELYESKDTRSDRAAYGGVPPYKPQKTAKKSKYEAFADYIDYNGYGGYQEYNYGGINNEELGDYYYDQYDDASFVYDDGLDYYYTLRRNGGYGNRYGRRKLLEFGHNEGFREGSSSWTLAAVFVVGSIMVLLCVIAAMIYRRHHDKMRADKTVKISDIKIVAVSRDEESGDLSNEAHAIKTNDS